MGSGRPLKYCSDSAHARRCHHQSSPAARTLSRSDCALEVHWRTRSLFSARSRPISPSSSCCRASMLPASFCSSCCSISHPGSAAGRRGELEHQAPHGGVCMEPFSLCNRPEVGVTPERVAPQAIHARLGTLRAGVPVDGLAPLYVVDSRRKGIQPSSQPQPRCHTRSGPESRQPSPSRRIVSLALLPYARYCIVSALTHLKSFDRGPDRHESRQHPYRAAVRSRLRHRPRSVSATVQKGA
ncbi:MAG: hypothetical protein J3K34DRAFT_237484 [Monoraphidium minutum]|nr:MAG: hypothetical protein J3K34DRAFT_237484 [Monoraphidium minutum]